MFKALVSASLAGAALAASIPSGSSTRPASLGFPDASSITAKGQSHASNFTTVGLQRWDPSSSSSKLRRRDYCSENTCRTTSEFTWGETDTGGKGIYITNAGDDWRGFYIYQNCCDDTPYKYIWINAGETEFVSFPSDFEGRIQRGVDSSMLDGSSQLLGTWFEFSWDSSGAAWADVSLIRGCDGSVLIWDKDNGDEWKGFTQDILEGAPYGAYDLKTDGQWVLAASEALGDSSDVNTIVRDWYIEKVGTDYVYVDDWHGNGAVIESPTGRIATYWPEGRP